MSMFFFRIMAMDPPLDLNLTALISSVERDILLLEQMETKSTKNQDPCDLPFPFSNHLSTLKETDNKLTSSGRVFVEISKQKFFLTQLTQDILKVK